MLLHIPKIFSAAQVADIRQQLSKGNWIDGRATSGPQAAAKKQNRQLDATDAGFASLSKRVEDALKKHPLFMAAVLPRHVLPPMFNCYEGGESYGNHIDNTVQANRFTGEKIRTDVSTTLFLSKPDEYDGGELVIEDSYGVQEIKLDAGDAIVYPSTSLHRVEPVTRGTRLASFLWSQSLVRNAAQRAMLFDLDMTIIKLRHLLGDTTEVTALTGHYHKLIQQWAET